MINLMSEINSLLESSRIQNYSKIHNVMMKEQKIPNRLFKLVLAINYYNQLFLMDLFSSTDTYLDHSFYLSLRELILLLMVVYQLGYYAGKKRVFSMEQGELRQNSRPVLCLPFSQTPESHRPPSEKDDERVQHSLKLICDSFQECSTRPATLDSQSDSLHSEKISPAKSEEEITRDFLSEKITVEGKKIQSRGIFHMTLEKAENPKFIRKIQKHQVITDYEVQSNNSSQSQLIPFGSKKLFQFTDESSILEISTYENMRLQKFPIIEKKLIKTHEFAQFENKNQVNIPMSASLCENGKFSKFFKNAKKIGEGAFGVVYSAQNIFEGKNYAVKKLFIKSSGLGKDKIEVILNESIKEVNIISQYSHPNIIRFYTCWLEIANLNESMIFNKMNFKEQSQSDYSDLQSSRQMNFKKKKSTEECLEVSYISSQANSGFAFEGESAKNITTSFRKSINSQVQECQVVSVIENQASISCQKQQNSPSNCVPVFALYIQMELCSEGSLDKYLHRRKSINRSFAFIVINQLLHGVEYLHLNGLVHRDLKPGNILINKKQMLIKIGDFGLSARVNDDIQYGKIGTPSYIAPEILEKRPIRKEQLHLIDVYSIGVIFYELLNLFNLATKHQKLQKINKLKQGKVDLSGEFGLEKKLIRFMTKSNNRLSIKEIFQRKEYLELSESVKGDLEIQESWDLVQGLEAE